MNIIGENPYVNPQAYVKTRSDGAPSRTSADGPSASEGKEDRVVLSPRVKAYQEAQNELKGLPDVREEKVAEIRQRLENGTYEVDSRQLASKMLKDVFVTGV